MRRTISAISLGNSLKAEASGGMCREAAPSSTREQIDRASLFSNAALLIMGRYELLGRFGALS